MLRENPYAGFPTAFDKNQAVQLQQMARGLKFQVKEVGGLHYVVKTKALISCAVTAQLICVFVFAYAKSSFSHYAAYLSCHKKTCLLSCILQVVQNRQGCQLNLHGKVKF